MCVTALDPAGKVQRVFLLCGKLILLVGLLYVFVCSLDILSSAFQLVGGELDERMLFSSSAYGNHTVQYPTSPKGSCRMQRPRLCVQAKQQATSFKTTRSCPTRWLVWSLASWSHCWCRAHPRLPPSSSAWSPPDVSLTLTQRHTLTHT